MPRYHCHNCNRSVGLREGDFRCSNCDGEFVEEIGDEVPQELNDFLSGLFNQRPRTPMRDANGDRAERVTDLDQNMQMIFNMISNNSNDPADRGTVRISIGGGQGGQGGAPRRGREGQFLQDLLSRFGGDGQMPDIWGAHTNAPSFGEEDIKKYLPITKVEQSQVDNGTQCTTCFDTFKLGDEVGILDCKHIFHRPCIEPWLKTKTSCPVCRQAVNFSKWKENFDRQTLESGLDDLD